MSTHKAEPQQIVARIRRGDVEASALTGRITALRQAQKMFIVALDRSSAQQLRYRIADWELDVRDEDSTSPQAVGAASELKNIRRLLDVRLRSFDDDLPF